MRPHFTDEMTTVGVLSIVVGIAGSIEYVFFVVGGGVAAALAAGGAGPAAAAGASAGSAFMALALVGLACQTALIVAGGGVIRFAWWGRKLSMASGSGLVAVNLLFMLLVHDGFHFVSAAVLIYGAMLALVCGTPHWKSTFRRGPMATIGHGPTAIG